MNTKATPEQLKTLAARVAALETALRELLAAHDDYPAIKDLPEMPHWTRARAALAKEGA